MTIEPITRQQVDGLIRSMSPMAAMIAELASVNLKAGRGVLEGRDRCLWTHDRRRITICLPSDGGLLASVAKQPDPECPV